MSPCSLFLAGRRSATIAGIVLLLAMASKCPFSSAQSTPSEGPAAIFERGQEALAKGSLDEAEANFRRVLKLDPRSAAARANLGVVAMRRKNWDQALAEFHKAQRLAPEMAGVRLNIGLVEYRRANYPSAIAPLQSVVKTQPD